MNLHKKITTIVALCLISLFFCVQPIQAITSSLIPEATTPTPNFTPVPQNTLVSNVNSRQENEYFGCVSPQAISGVDYFYINGPDRIVRSRKVTLNFFVPDATEMIISNNAKLIGAKWEPYVSTKTWILGKNLGVYAAFRNKNSCPDPMLYPSFVPTELVTGGNLLRSSDHEDLNVFIERYPTSLLRFSAVSGYSAGESRPSINDGKLYEPAEKRVINGDIHFTYTYKNITKKTQKVRVRLMYQDSSGRPGEEKVIYTGSVKPGTTISGQRDENYYLDASIKMTVEDFSTRRKITSNILEIYPIYGRAFNYNESVKALANYNQNK